ncbi:MAG: HAD-IIA family hydrolase [Clostridia bacterium]|nr:HAD-IIA family hydrolase [Clostridia bacterium]
MQVAGRQNSSAPDLTDIECYVLDMDGTINLGDTPIEGAHELIEELRRRGIPFYFFTNNSSRSPQAYVERLHALGFTGVGREQIMTSGDVMIDYLQRHHPDPLVYLAGTPALREQFEQAGIRLADETCSSADFAVLGFDTTFSFAKADTLCRLVSSGVPFLATNIDRVCPLEGGAFLPDCGSMAAMIEHATGVSPQFIGKPFPETSEYILRHASSAPERTAVVGDRIYTDIMTAVNGGLVGIAVLSGEIGWEDIEQGQVTPDYVLESVADITAALRRYAGYD